MFSYGSQGAGQKFAIGVAGGALVFNAGSETLTGPMVADGNWHDIICDTDGKGVVRLVVDGSTPVPKSFVSLDTALSGTFNLGREAVSASKYLPCNLYDFGIVARQLTKDERDAFRSSKSPSGITISGTIPDGAVIYYPVAAGGGDMIMDRGSAGENGSLKNGIAWVPEPKININFFALPQRVRAGALDLEFGPIADITLGSYEIDSFDSTFGNDSAVTADFFSNRLGGTLPNVDLSLQLRVERLEPGGQDNLPDEPYSPDALSVAIPTVPAGPNVTDAPTLIEARFVREPPVVIMANDTAPAGRFTLEWDESAGSNQSQSLSMTLYMRDAGDVSQQPAVGSDTSMRLVVIDRNPFLVARVSAPPFAGLAGADGSRQVAAWMESAPGGASWELAGGSGGYPLTLPPQCLGEQIEDHKGDIAENAPLGFAFSPPASFSIVASPLDQNYTEASWNLRRIFGYPSERSPGAVVKSLSFELLYGLPCSVTYPYLFLAELAARLGALPGPLPDVPQSPLQSDDGVTEQGDLFKLVSTRWSRLYRSLLSRLSILEPWDADQPGTLSLDENVQYAVLRTGR